MADSTFATFDSLTSVDFQDYLVGYRGIRETQINYTDFINNSIRSSLSSERWDSVYSTVKSLSDTWEESVFITPLQVASASWDSVYSSVRTSSASWDSVYNNVNSNSASWDSVYSNVRTSSASWDSVYSNVRTGSAGWEATESKMYASSASWDSVYSTVNSISSIIPDPATTICAQIGVGTTALSSIDFLNTSSAQLLYTVPAGKVFLATDFSIIIDAVAGGNANDTSLPIFRLYRSDTLTNAANQVTNQLTLTSPTSVLITTNRYYRMGGSATASNGKALVSGNDASPQNKIWFRVDSAGTNPYTALSGRVLVTGNLI